MGKHGPCRHCGVTSTPLWRNGPPEKPVLCNACGSRWRTKGTLLNYRPLHARAEPEEVDNSRTCKGKTISSKTGEAKLFKRKFTDDIAQFRVFPPDNHGFRKGFDEDTSNRSSSGSAISNPESCAHYGSADASDLTGPPQPIVWDTNVPSRKRTCFARQKPSPVEKLTKDLYAIWHEQQSSCLSGSSEEDLLLETDKPMVSVEIGHGSVLIRHPNSIAREEESEASSFSIDNKQHTLNSRQMIIPGPVEDICVNSASQGIVKIKRTANEGIEQERIRDKDQHEKFEILGQHCSPIFYIDPQDLKCKSGIVEPEYVGGFNSLATDHSSCMKRSRDGQHQIFAGSKAIMKSPRRNITKPSYGQNELTDKGYCFPSSKGLFPSRNDNCSLVLDSSNFAEGSPDENVLLDVLSSNGSFPQAELLVSTSSLGALASTSSSSV